MIDLKSKLVLKILAKEASDGGYKVIEIADVIMALPKRFRMDTDAVKHILTHLERQDIISIKYDEDNVYCLAVLPYGFELLENDNPKKQTNSHNKLWFCAFWFMLFLAAALGSTLGSVICHFLLK